MELGDNIKCLPKKMYQGKSLKEENRLNQWQLNQWPPQSYIPMTLEHLLQGKGSFTKWYHQGSLIIKNNNNKTLEITACLLKTCSTILGRAGPGGCFHGEPYEWECLPGPSLAGPYMLILLSGSQEVRGMLDDGVTEMRPAQAWLPQRIREDRGINKRGHRSWRKEICIETSQGGTEQSILAEGMILAVIEERRCS